MDIIVNGIIIRVRLYELQGKTQERSLKIVNIGNVTGVGLLGGAISEGLVSPPCPYASNRNANNC
eukprot:335619-Prorocentrum_minimum.AAC.2